MNRTSHMLIGAAGGLLVARAVGVDPFLCAAIGALTAPLPDIDQRWARSFDKPRAGAPAGLLEHRGPTHSVLAIVLLFGSLALAGLPMGLVLAGAVGYLSHLVADGISYMGVPYLWPFGPRYRLLPYGWRTRSGSVVEMGIALGTTLVAGVYAVLPTLPY
jgi:inner membrane protein